MKTQTGVLPNYLVLASDGHLYRYWRDDMLAIDIAEHVRAGDAPTAVFRRDEQANRYTKMSDDDVASFRIGSKPSSVVSHDPDCDDPEDCKPYTCDACGATVPRCHIARCEATGIETYACRRCRHAA